MNNFITLPKGTLKYKVEYVNVSNNKAWNNEKSKISFSIYCYGQGDFL